MPFYLEIGFSNLPGFLKTADLGGQPVALQVRVIYTPEERIVDQALPVITGGMTEGSLSLTFHRICVVLQRVNRLIACSQKFNSLDFILVVILSFKTKKFGYNSQLVFCISF